MICVRIPRGASARPPLPSESETKMTTEIRTIQSTFPEHMVPEKGESVTLYEVTIEHKDETISKFIIKLGRSKFGYPELSMVTRAKNKGKKRIRSLQSIPIDPTLWEKKKKKNKETVSVLNQE